MPLSQRDFRCAHCSGRILIPWDLPPTTGPCPHCGGVITSPALETRLPPLQMPVAPVPTPEHEVAPIPPKPVAQPPLPPVGPVPLPEVEVAKPQLEPLRVTDLPPESPKALPSRPAPGQPAPAPPKPGRNGLMTVLLVLVLLLLAVGVAVYLVIQQLSREPEVLKMPPPVGASPISEANYIRNGWQRDAYELLRNYMAATTSQEKLPFIIHGSALATRLEDFYGGSQVIDTDTPAEGFSVYELSEEDRKRGLFMMVYDQPPQFEMKEFFRPLASLEVQYGVDEADLLPSTLARVGNFAMEPLRVHAFFKRSPEGLKLDWEIFAQTKYRTFQNFVELPEIGQSAVFRVFIVEDVPDKGRAVAGTRSYRLADPANSGDAAQVNVKIDSQIGSTLSIINWRGTEEKQPITRTATVELKWLGENHAPELVISRFICWEFLGLGGEETPATVSTQ